MRILGVLGELESFLGITFPAADARLVLVFVFVALFDDHEFAHLGWRLLLSSLRSGQDHALPEMEVYAHPVSGRLQLPAHVQRERVLGLCDMQAHMRALVV